MAHAKRTVPRQKKPRRRFDTYETPLVVAQAIIRDLAQDITFNPRRILEPSSGGAAFVKAAATFWPEAKITAVDIRPECENYALMSGASKFIQGDFEEVAAKAVGNVDLVIGNPPFTYAERHLRAIWKNLLPGGTVAFLLGSGFLAGKDRWDGLYREMPLRAFAPIAPRPSFLHGGGTDMREYGLFVWTKEWVNHAQLWPAIRWERPSRRKKAA